MLLVVSNLGNTDLEGAWVKLKLGANMSAARNAVTGEDLPVEDRSIFLALPPYDPQLILAWF